MSEFNSKKFKTLRRFYLHPHGLGDLILSMSSLEYVMGKDFSFGLIVKNAIYDSGFFKNYPYKERVFSGCPCIWGRFQVVKNFKNIDKAVTSFKRSGIDAFYLKFNKNIDRRLQANRGLSQYLGIDIPFDDRIHGKIYLEDKDINWVQNNISSRIFFQTLRPKNININKIFYGNIVDALNAFLFCSFKS